MSEFITINNATLVQGTTASLKYLTCKINNRNIGLPAFTFATTTPNIDLLPPTPGLTFPEQTSVYDSATAYDVGLALTVNNSAMCVPLYKIQQDQYEFPNIMFENPMLVTNLTARNDYLITFLDDPSNTTYGIPLYNYGALYQTSPVSGVALSAVPITTVIHTGKPVSNIVRNAGSTNLNPRIVAYSDLITRVKQLLGWPSINIDLCDENIVAFVDQAMEKYTKFTGYTEEYLVFNTNIYKKGLGIRLDNIFSCTSETKTTTTQGMSGIYDYDLKDYRKVVDVWSFEQGEGTGINTLFTLEQAMAQQTYFSYMLGNVGFDLVTFDILKGWLETRSKILAQTPYFRFDPRTQVFRILPEPYEGQAYYGCIGCYVERPIKDLISEPWIIDYTLALTKISVGHIRGKFGNMAIFGGGQLNANDVLSQGLKEKDELDKQLITGTGFSDVTPVKFFMG
jgi:hypothetical protein